MSSDLRSPVFPAKENPTQMGEKGESVDLRATQAHLSQRGEQILVVTRWPNVSLHDTKPTWEKGGTLLQYVTNNFLCFCVLRRDALRPKPDIFTLLQQQQLRKRENVKKAQKLKHVILLRYAGLSIPKHM